MADKMASISCIALQSFPEKIIQDVFLSVQRNAKRYKINYFHVFTSD